MTRLSKRPSRKCWRCVFFWDASGPGIPSSLDLEEVKPFYDMRNKTLRRLLFWLRCLTLVNRVPKLRFEHVLSYNCAYKIIKKRKIEPLNLKNIQNPWKCSFFFETFLLELWRKHFWESWNSSTSSDSSFAEIFFKISLERKF